MAEPLKDRIHPGVVDDIAERYASAWAPFDAERFRRRAKRGLGALELMDRARHIAAALDEALPTDDRAIDIFIDTLGPELEGETMGGLTHFIDSAWLLARAPTAGFDEAMVAVEALTRRFTSEFAVRPLIERDPERALAWLQAWARSDNLHVRRLVSEGTRPRLPWAPRLDVFEGAYAPVIELLDVLVDDPALYVRRSVANHLGDLAKVDLPLALDVAARWWRQRDGDPARAWVVRHALRHPLKQGQPEALAVVGDDGDVPFAVTLTLAPDRVALGETVAVELALHNPTDQRCTARADLVVDYAAAGGKPRTKVFRMPPLALEAGERTSLVRRLKMVHLSTRRLVVGEHRVALKLAGQVKAEATFELTEA